MACCVCGADDFADGWQRWDDHPAQREWDILKDLGAGAGSQVVLARHRGTGEYAALKVVFLENPQVADDPEHLANLQRESDLLAMLDHPNIVECRDVIRSPRQLVLVLEWLRGGQVIDRLHELGLQYSEQQAAAIFVQVAQAVAYLHEYSILHRDIKPENVMFATPPGEAGGGGAAPPPLTAAQLQAAAAGRRGAPGPPPQAMPVVKLVDLGMACLYDPAKPQRGPLGSPGFVAPEIVADGVHTPAMDVFSLGVLLFIMLVGRKPFNIRESEDLRYALLPLQEAPGLRDPRWLDLSPDAKHLVMGMICYDPARRLTMQQVLRHEWVASRGGVLPRPLGQDVVYGAATVASIRRLRNLCGGVVAFNRAAAAASGAGRAAGSRSGQGQGHTPADSAKDAYLRRLKQSQRLEHSWRGGGAVKRMALGLAGSAYAKAHDAGGSLHPANDPSSSGRRGGRAAAGPGAAAAAGSVDGSARSGRRFALPWQRQDGSQASLHGGSMHGRVGDPSASRRARFASVLPGGLNRAGTTVMLSEMERISWGAKGSGEGSASGSARRLHGRSLASMTAADGGDAGGAGGAEAWQAAAAVARPPSTLQLLSAAAKAYLEGSTHGGSRRAGSAALAALKGGGGSTGALRQVADDSSAARRRRQLAGLADASTGSSSTTSSSRGVGGLAGLAQQPGQGQPQGLGQQQGAAAQQGDDASERRQHGPSRSSSGCLASPARPAALPPAAARLASTPRPVSEAGASAHSTSSSLGLGSRPGSLDLQGLRPTRVVQWRGVENPLVPGGGATSPPPPAGGRTWAEMQALLRQQAAAAQPTPRSGSRSREGTAGSTPGTRVVRIKPLE